MPRRSTQPQQQPGARDRLEQNQARHLAEFGKFLSEKSYANKWSQQNLARRAGVHQTTISRAERGVLASMSRPTAHALMRAYELDPDEEVKWLRILFGAPPITRDLSLVLHPRALEGQFEFHLRHGVRESPEVSRQFGSLFGDLLEDVARGAMSSIDQSTFQHLSRKARLIEAWGQINVSSKADLHIPSNAIKHIIDGHKDDIYILGRLLILTSETMQQNKSIDDPEELVHMVKKARKTEPYITALLFEEIVTQYIYSPNYTMKHIINVVQQGKRYCRQDPQLHTKMIRLDVLHAVAIFMKANDPRKGVELMHEVIAQLRLPKHNSPGLLIEALAFGAEMTFHADMFPQQAATMLAEAYQRAQHIGAAHLTEWIVETATTFDVSLQLDGSTSM